MTSPARAVSMRNPNNLPGCSLNYLPPDGRDQSAQRRLVAAILFPTGDRPETPMQLGSGCADERHSYPTETSVLQRRGAKLKCVHGSVQYIDTRSLYKSIV